MTRRGATLEIGSSPHVVSGASVDGIMRNVIYALLPVAAFAVFAFGLPALLVLATATLSCLATEALMERAMGRPLSMGDGSGIVTGLLFGLTLPPHLPLWMVALGGAFGMGLTKALFGGLGSNAFNPALVGRAFLQAAFPAAMTHWSPAMLADRFTSLPASLLAWPLARPDYDAVTSATPLSVMKFQDTGTGAAELALGLTSGSTGETSALLILAGGVYLAARGMLNWRIPAAILAGVGALTVAANISAPGVYPGPLFMLLSGGLMLGAVFMATDPVASPITNSGCWLYGLVIAVLVVVIRLWGAMPEGVMYAILLANAIAPHIDRHVQPRSYGSGS